MSLRALAAGVLVLTIGLPLMILLLLEPSPSRAACTPAGGGPASVPGIPTQLLPVFEAAAARYQLGSDGWAYLAALNYDESTFDTSAHPGVHDGQNADGAAGPMQIGNGTGKAGDGWAEIVDQIPANLPGGTSPPSVYNETDAVYGAAALLSSWGAPRNWPAVLTKWDDFPPEINLVQQLATGWTNSPNTNSSSTISEPVAAGAGCGAGLPAPTVPGQAATIGPDGLASIPAGAPKAVQEALQAGNEIVTDSYSHERNPGMLVSNQGSYDCSGAIDWILAHAGQTGPAVNVGNETAGDSSDLEQLGAPGAGEWITVWANSIHAFMQVDGLVLDTAYYASVNPTTPADGPRWQPANVVAKQIAGDRLGWFTERHPIGL